MKRIPISGLTAASSLDGTEVVPVVQGGVTKKADANTLFDGVRSSFDTIALVAASSRLRDGQYYRAESGYNGEPETFLYDASSTDTADGVTIVEQTALGGRLISTRTWFKTVAELFADTRSFATGAILEAEGFRYEVAAPAATDHTDARADGVKLYNLTGRNAAAATKVAALGDGQIATLDGLAYEVDSSATVAASATNDLGVDGIKPFGTPEVGHYGTPGSASALLRLIANGGSNIKIPAGTYSLDEGLSFSGQISIEVTGDVVLDFTSITSASSVSGRGYFDIDGGALVQLPSLSADASKGDTSISISASGLAIGDWICIYDPTDFSFSGFNSTYRDGQWCRVAAVSGSTVTLFDTILRDYAAATVEVYKHPGSTFRISGPGDIIIKESLHNDASLNSKAGFCATRYIDSDFSKVKSQQSDYGAMLLRQCINVSGTGYKTTQASSRTGGLNYGVVLAGCQNVNIQGDFYGYNHAVTVGGGDGAGFVPCRYIYFGGAFTAHPSTTIGAANFHGHCEYVHFDGFFDGGVTGGGDFIKVSGTVRGRGNQSPIYLNELRGANVDLSGVRIETEGNPHLNAGGCIDIGSNAANQMNANTVNGGLINLKDIVIQAPNSQRGFVIRNRGCTQDVAINITGMMATLASGGIHYSDVVSGSNFTDLFMSGASLGTTALQNLTGFDEIHGWEVSGSVDLTTLTSQPNRSTSISYQTPGSKTPLITTGLVGDRIVGGKPIVSGAESATSTSAFIFINSADNANFSSSETATIAYRITV